MTIMTTELRRGMGVKSLGTIWRVQTIEVHPGGSFFTVHWLTESGETHVSDHDALDTFVMYDYVRSGD